MRKAQIRPAPQEEASSTQEGHRLEEFKRTHRKLPLDLLPDDYFHGTFASAIANGNLNSTWRRAFDVAAAACGLAISLPFVIPLSLLILVDDGRPVFFLQQRLGRNEIPFRLIKLRSMVRNAGTLGDSWTDRNDPRITRLGRVLRRFRLDELPQFVNVLAGDMSIIGPRPEQAQLASRFKELVPHYGWRFRVKPGVTGWAQVNYPYGVDEADAREKLQYDLFYLEERSVALDLRILLKTVYTMLFCPGR